MAHFALSDIDGNQFFHTERLNRSGPGIAGVDAGQGLIWNGNWSVKWSGDDQKLNALANDFEVDLMLRSVKPPVVHGTEGISRKAAGPGRASHYISLTRLITKGGNQARKSAIHSGGSLLDGPRVLFAFAESNQAGWDWFSLQFNNGSELMLYRLRRKDGTVEPYSSGTYVDRPDGRDLYAWKTSRSCPARPNTKTIPSNGRSMYRRFRSCVMLGPGCPNRN